MHKRFYFKKIFILFSLVIFWTFTYDFITSFAFAETIILKSGSKIEAKILEKTDKYIKVDFSGITLIYWLDEIDRIEEAGVSYAIEGNYEKDKPGLPTTLATVQSQKLFNEGLDYSHKGMYDEAIKIFKKGIEVCPEDCPAFPAQLGSTYHYQKKYEDAIPYLLSAFQMCSEASETTEIKEMLSSLHYLLIDSYNELGQKYYFSKELCLRIIYHIERYLELHPERQSEIMEFLKKTIDHLDLAEEGATVMETGSLSDLSESQIKIVQERIIQGKTTEDFELPNDNISLEDKLAYKERAIKRLKK